MTLENTDLLRGADFPHPDGRIVSAGHEEISIGSHRQSLDMIVMSDEFP